MCKSHLAAGLLIRAGLVVFNIALVAIFLASPVRAITPDNPRVKAAVKEAIEYLEGADDGRLGAKALVGLTFAKYGSDPTHPKIASAIAALQNALKNGPEKFRSDIYSTGVSIMFLVAVDPSRYRYEIETLVKSLHLRQKPHGAWGYPITHEKHGTTCDTSMTQYAVLGLWEAEDQAGIETPRLVWDRVARWLLLTQDDTGGFGYQGNPATRLGRTIKQSGVRHSMTVAALASLYIVKDRVGITKLKKLASDDTPEAFQPYESPEERAARIKTRIDLRHFARALAGGNRWIEDKYDVDTLTGHIHYSLYALERYESLREAESIGRAEPSKKSDDSKWYNRGARFLLRTQNDDGSWESGAGAVPDTCFGALFLMSSTRKTLAASSVARYTAGTLVGGHGMPASDEVRLRDGQLVVQPMEGPLKDVLPVAMDPAAANHAAAVERLAELASNGSTDELNSHVASLRGLALAGPSESRRFAIRCLARTKQLDHVPLLIHLLSDENPEVMRQAGEALGALSRKYTTFGLRASSSDAERQKAIERWKQWYRSIRPDVDVDALDPRASES